MKHLFGCGSLGVAGVLATLALGPAQPAAAATTAATTAAWCPVPALTHPFSGDSRWYALAPGETADSFAGTGWVLTGGAHVETVTLADGATGSVLDLPAGSTATSSPMCVDSSYPLARMETRTLGKAPSNATTFYAVPVGGVQAGGMPVLGTTSWATSPPDNVAGGGASAEQVQYKFVAGKNAADLEVYDLYIDPSMRK